MNDHSMPASDDTTARIAVDVGGTHIEPCFSETGQSTCHYTGQTTCSAIPAKPENVR